LLGKWRNNSPSDILTASASSFVVVLAKPLRVKSGAAAAIALRRLVAIQSGYRHAPEQ
jgi:hypothetical protein